jgi:hypothetical protein
VADRSVGLREWTRSGARRTSWAGAYRLGGLIVVAVLVVVARRVLDPQAF